MSAPPFKRKAVPAGTGNSAQNVKSLRRLTLVSYALEGVPARTRGMPSNADLTVARHVALIAPGLTSAAKAVFGVLLSHLNTTNGRCEPSVARLKHCLPGLSRTQILRATASLSTRDEAYGRPALINKVSHGGRWHTSRYAFEWSAIGQWMDAHEALLRRKPDPSKVPFLMPESSHKRDFSGAIDATETLSMNSFYELSSAAQPHEEPREDISHIYKRRQPPERLRKSKDARPIKKPHLQVVETNHPLRVEEAKCRINDALLRCDQLVAGAALDLPEQTWNSAIEAEMARPGAGVALLLEALRKSGLPS